MRRAIADWSAGGLAVADPRLGGLIVVKPAVDHWDDLYRGDPFEVGTTTQIVQKTPGKKVDRTTDHDDRGLVVVRGAAARRERDAALSGSCWWRSSAFLAAAVLQRAILGDYGAPAQPRRPRRRRLAPAESNGTRCAPRAGERRTADGERRRSTPTAPTGATLAPGIAKLVASRREALGLSQRELAKRAGISHTVISRIEGGEHSPSPKTLERLADALS